MRIVLTRNQILRLVAVSSIVQGILSAYLILRLEEVLAQDQFLADIVSRNVEVLEEFDIIALRELGIVKKATE